MKAREKEIYRVTLIGTSVNAALIIFKFLAGIFGRSSAMIADAVHSLSDFITDAIVLIFVKIASKPRDKGHEFGHGKFETFATMIIGLILAFAGVGLMINGVDSVIRSFRGEILPRPGMLALIVAVASIVSKEWLYRYTRKVGEENRSQVVIANAWHHRSDSISSIGTLIGIAGAMFLGEHWRVLDPVAAVVVSLLIIKSGYDIMRPAVNELLEAALPDDQQNRILEIVKGIKGIDGVHNLRTRRIGSNVAIDLHANMDGNMTLSQAHALATKAEVALRQAFGAGTIVTIHMEPTSHIH